MHLSKALVLVAGNASSVERVSAALQGKEAVLPWLAVRDRDLAEDLEVQSWVLRDPHLFVWKWRSIENMFIDARWIAATIDRVGMTMAEEDVWARMSALSLGQRDDVEFLLTEKRLSVAFPTESVPRRDSRAWYDAVAKAALSKRDAHDETRNEIRAGLKKEWDSRWPEWVQAKRIFAEFVVSTPFRSLQHLLDAMVALSLENDKLFSW